MKLTYNVTNETGEEPANKLDFSIKHELFEVTFFGCINRKPLPSQIRDLIKSLSGEEGYENVCQGFSFDEDDYLCISNKKLSIDNVSITMTDELRQHVIPMLKDMYKMCGKSELDVYLEQIKDYTLEQLPVIRKLDGVTQMIQCPKYARPVNIDSIRLTHTDIDTICAALQGDTENMRLSNNSKLRFTSKNLLIDYGFDDVYFAHHMDNQTFRNNLVKELQRIKGIYV